MSVPFAHAGHWFAALAYAAPVLVLIAWMLVVKVKERRAPAGSRPPGTPRPPGEDRGRAPGPPGG